MSLATMSIKGDEDDDTSIHTTLYFLARDELYKTEKPYSLRYRPDGDLPQSNIRRDKFKVTIKDIRKGEAPLLEKKGFQVMHLHSAMQYEDFADDEMIRDVYLPEIQTALLKELDGRHVHVIDFAVRRRHSQFPISTGTEIETLQPAALAHVDFTVREGERLIEVMYGERAVELLSGHWQIINIWRPLRGPLNDWPLAVCDAQSVDYRNDIMAGDLVYENFATENLQIMHNVDQKWFYLPDQTTTEVLIFKSADSDHSEAPGQSNNIYPGWPKFPLMYTMLIEKASPHAAFHNPKVAPEELPRESINCRAFVFYIDLPDYPPVVEDVFQSIPTQS
ncbi:hypothetical protein ONS95_012084 [Cadophora gregata]|uniref:uncharacterized protein n=1 Tax=Cadophora gregata TaxID=51156 RepID=UPI0026DD43DB|nr:uncharacterized protein ONS95_012084 [Cadophora gregata]KAK0117758.1 hypothetical protein ONS95_012084 [Cadophora gregata]KAK0122807.1 hypothetical protein ONS96_009841 [Cadophora gregata f. sp. sojae]